MNYMKTSADNMKVVDNVFKAVCMSCIYEFVDNTKLIRLVALTKTQIYVETISTHLLLILEKNIRLPKNQHTAFK